MEQRGTCNYAASFSRSCQMFRSFSAAVLWLTALALLSGCSSHQPQISRNSVAPGTVVSLPGSTQASSSSSTAAPTPVTVDTETEQTDLACSYFYFLWGTQAEFHKNYAEALEAYEKAHICDPSADYIREKIPLLLLKMDDRPRATEWLQTAIEDEPDKSSYKLLLAGLYIQQNDFERGIALYKSVLNLEPDNENVQLRLALLYGHLKRFDEAEKLFAKILLKNPNSYYGHLSLARLLRDSGRVKEAVGEYEQALALNWSKELALELGYYHMDDNEFRTALAVFDLVIEIDHLDERAAMARIQALLDLNRSDDALASLYAMKDFSANPAGLDIIISKVLLRENRTDEAKNLLKKLVNRSDSTEARFMLGLLAFQENDIPQSLDYLQSIEPDAAEYEDAVYLQVRIYQQAEQLSKAEKLLEACIADSENRQPSFYLLLSSLYQQSKKYRACLGMLADAVLLYPENTQLHFEYGMMLEHQGLAMQAMHEMTRILELDPDHAEALNFIGYTWADQSINLDKALQYIERANQLRPDNGFIMDSLGWIYFRLNRLEQATTALERALELQPDDPHIHEHIGDVYRARQLNDKALKAYMTAEQLFAENEKQQRVQGKIDALRTIP